MITRLTSALLLCACRPAPAPTPEPRESAPPVVDSDADTDWAGETGLEQVPGSAVAPGDDVFRDDVVHAFTLSLDAAAWDSLLASPQTYVEADFDDGTSTWTVGVRLKGYSSFQPLTGKPNLRVSFDKLVPGQRYDDLEAIDLVSEAEDPAAMSEALAYRLFRAAGNPASRTGFAWLRINDLDYGLYTLVEKKDDVLVEQWWPDDDDGSLYESSSDHWPCDLDDAGSPRCDCWEQDEVGAEDTRADLEALCAVATDTADADWYAAVQASTDWEEIRHHMALEILLDAYDHYAGYMGNVYLYHSPEAGGWSLLPASMNSAFGSSRYIPGSCGSSGRVPTDFNGGVLIRRCWKDEACTADLYDALYDAIAALEASDLQVQLDAWEALLGPYAAADPRSGYSADAFEAQVGCIRDWLSDRPAALVQELPATCLGEDGVLDVRGWGDLSVNGSCDRDWPDAVSYPVVSLDGASVGLGVAPDGIAAGDEVLVWVAQSQTDDTAAVGAIAFADVVSTTSTGLALDRAPDLGLSDLSAYKVLIQRVPHYSAVTVRAGGTLTAGAWDGATGGVLALRVSGDVTVEAGGAISASGLGYAGGDMGASYNTDGYQGESLAGPGLGGASSTEGYNEANGAWAANLGGGGCNVGGGGGEHAGGATASSSWNGTATAPQAGEPVGSDDGTHLLVGSGGGGVVNLGGASGPGGAGGGLLYLEADTLTALGEGALQARGADTDHTAVGSWSYGAGGGAGGSVWLVVRALSLVDGAVLATGGAGAHDATRPGGDGGAGRIWVDCATVDGLACGAATLAGLCAPEAVDIW